MSNLETFDDFLSTENYGAYEDAKPFQFRENQDNEEETLTWLNDNFEAMYKSSQSRLETYRRYISLYKGVHWRGKSSDLDSENFSGRKPKMTVNFIHEMTESKVSQRSKAKLGVSVLPNNHDEQSDINNAKACKLLLDARSIEMDLDKKHQDLDRIVFNLGHGFMYVPWDKDLGPEHPVYTELKAKHGGKIPKATMKKLNDADSVKVGDAIAIPVGGDKVFVELGKKTWDDMNHVDYIEWKHIDEVKADYPSRSEDIGTQNRSEYHYDINDYEVSRNFIMVRHFWHKKTKHLPEGAYIKYTDDCILEWNDHPYDDGELPFIPDTDIDVYGEFWGRSFITNIEQMQRMFNVIQSGQARDYALGSAPKWLVPKGSVKHSSLSNEFTIVEYAGASAPQLVRNNPVSDQGFTIQDRLESKITQHSTVYDISRGEVPQGVTANSALRFLDEQESQRNSTGVSKRRERLLKVYRMLLVRMKQFYKASDNRTIRILGKNNEYLIKNLSEADFTRVYDIKLQNSSALPDSKSGRISTIVDLNLATQTDPVFKKEEVIKMLDLGLDDAFKDNATAAVDAAKQILEMMLDDEQVVEPKEYDDLLVHYSIFTKEVQKINFKMKVNPQIQVKVFQHIMVMEGLMWNKSQTNQKFAMELQQFSMFPIFFVPVVPPMPQPMMPPNEQGGVDSKEIKNMPTQQGENNEQQQ
ncbi:MAG: hypothetical protein DRG33_05015 [Deltaproteobacteria bacterium]|nr:MAG: hypothetical protein DRG33_05015 [Deltaproteobacteria bacterium]